MLRLQAIEQVYVCGRVCVRAHAFASNRVSVCVYVCVYLCVCARKRLQTRVCKLEMVHAGRHPLS